MMIKLVKMTSGGMSTVIHIVYMFYIYNYLFFLLYHLHLSDSLPLPPFALQIAVSMHEELKSRKRRRRILNHVNESVRGVYSWQLVG